LNKRRVFVMHGNRRIKEAMCKSENSKSI